MLDALIDKDGLNGHGGSFRVVAAFLTSGITMVFAGVLFIPCFILVLIAVFFLGIAPFYAVVDAFNVIVGRQAALQAPWIYLSIPVYYILFKLARRE